MEVRQLSIFLNNEPGSLSKVCQILEDAKVNIRALSIVDSTDFGLLRLIVDKTDLAIKTLEEGNHSVKITPVLVAELGDQPGGLNAILTPLHKHGVNIEYVYAFAGGAKAGNALVLFKFDDNKAAAAVMANENITLLGEKDIAAI